jgi:hypothetical protein
MAKKSVSRYLIGTAELNGKPEKFISRTPADLSAENRNRLFVTRGFQIDRKQLEDPEHPKNTIYLDGACQGPYQDVARHIYSLDHHEGCYRSITIASCEQALRLTRKKIIGAVGFNIIANDPDPDTVLAAWQILQADRMAFDKRLFRKIRPVVNLEGNIDAHGFGHEEFTDLSQESLEENRRRIDYVFAEERELKAKGHWEKTDFLEYTKRAFMKLDKVAQIDEHMAECVRIDALDEVPLSDDKNEDKNFTLVVSSSGNIYDVENEILRRDRRKNKKTKCVCTLFHDGRTKFTLKLIGFVSEFDLKPVYARLNDAEDSAKLNSGVLDDKFLNNGWGGSPQVGGAPRYPNGAGPFLGLSTIKKIVAEELQKQAAAIRSLHAKDANSNGHSNGNGHPKPPADPASK